VPAFPAAVRAWAVTSSAGKNDSIASSIVMSTAVPKVATVLKNCSSWLAWRSTWGTKRRSARAVDRGESPTPDSRSVPPRGRRSGVRGEPTVSRSSWSPASWPCASLIALNATRSPATSSRHVPRSRGRRSLCGQRRRPGGRRRRDARRGSIGHRHPHRRGPGERRDLTCPTSPASPWSRSLPRGRSGGRYSGHRQGR